MRGGEAPPSEGGSNDKAFAICCSRLSDVIERHRYGQQIICWITKSRRKESIDGNKLDNLD